MHIVAHVDRRRPGSAGWSSSDSSSAMHFPLCVPRLEPSITSARGAPKPVSTHALSSLYRSRRLAGQRSMGWRRTAPGPCCCWTADADERRLISRDRRARRLERRSAPPMARPRWRCFRARTAARSRRRCSAAGTASSGPQLIAALREQRDQSAGDRPQPRRHRLRSRSRRCASGATDFLVRPVAPERLLEALAANADRRRGVGRAGAGVGEARAGPGARAAGRRRPRIPRRAGGRRQGGPQPPADPDHRRAGHRQGNHRPRDPRRQPARQGAAADARLQGDPGEHHRQRAVRP